MIVAELTYAQVDLTQIAIGLFTMLGVIGGAFFSYKAHAVGKENRDYSKQVNDAVNNVHQTPGSKRIYDIAISNSAQLEELVEWRRSYKDSPWNDGEKVNAWLAKHDSVHERIERHLNKKEKP